MNAQVIAAIITGLCTIVAVVVSNELQLRAQDRRQAVRDEPDEQSASVVAPNESVVLFSTNDQEDRSAHHV